MGFNLRNWLEESIADVNPFDNGATAQTVRAKRVQPAPAQTTNRPAPLTVRQAQPQAQLRVAQPARNNFSLGPQVSIPKVQMPKVQTFGQSSDPLKVGQVKTPQIQLQVQPTLQTPKLQPPQQSTLNPQQQVLSSQLQKQPVVNQRPLQVSQPQQPRLYSPVPVSGVSQSAWNAMTPQAQQAMITREKAQKQAQSDVWNPIKIGGDIVHAGGQAAKAAVDLGAGMINDLGNRTADFGEAGATVIGELNGQNKRNEEQIQRYIDEETRMRDSFVNRARNATSQAEFDKYVNMARSLDAGISDNTDRLNALRNEGLENTDPMKTVSNAGMTALDLATLGKGKVILEGAKLGTKVTAPVLGQLARNTAITGVQGAGIGGAYGGLGTMKDPNATAEDYIKNIGTGALVGGGLGIGAQVALPVAGVAAKQAVKGTESAIVRSANYGLKPPTNLSKDELYIASKVRQAREGYISPQDITVQEAAIYQNIQRKLGAKPGTPDGEMAVVDALGAHRDFETKRAVRKDATLNALEKSSDFTRQHLVPGGTLMGVKAKGFKDAQAKGLVFDGVDGKPRFEVDDSGAKILDDYFDERQLQDVLDHPKLYEQYPELRNMTIVEQPALKDRGARGMYDEANNALAVSPDLLRNPEKLKSTILHELQHAIQKKEDFARGGSLETFTGDETGSRYKEITKALKDLKPKTDAITSEINQALAVGDMNTVARLSDHPLIKRRGDLVREQNDIVINRQRPREAYNNLAGEAEARAVQARRNMPMSERYVPDQPVKKQLPVASSEKAQPTGKYKKTLNVLDKDDEAYLRRIFTDEQVDNFKAGDFSHWRGGGKEYFEDIAHMNITSETPKTQAQKLEGRIAEYKLGSNKVYHATDSSNTSSILSGGFKKGSKLPKNAYRGGGYGHSQDSISFATTPVGTDRFATGSRGVMFESELKPNAKVVEINGITDATELDEFIPELKKQGIDAVHIGGGESEIVVINPKAVKRPTNYREFDTFGGKAKEQLKGFGTIPKQNLRSTFYDSLDVPKEDLIIRNDGGKAMSIEPTDPTAALKAETPYKSFKRKDGKTNITIDGKIQTFDEATNQLGERITRLKKPNGDVYSVKGWVSDGSWNIKDGGQGEIAWLNKKMADEPVIGRKQEIARQRYQLEQAQAHTPQPKPTLQDALAGKTTKVDNLAKAREAKAQYKAEYDARQKAKNEVKLSKMRADYAKNNPAQPDTRTYTKPDGDYYPSEDASINRVENGITQDGDRLYINGKGFTQLEPGQKIDTIKDGGYTYRADNPVAQPKPEVAQAKATVSVEPKDPTTISKESSTGDVTMGNDKVYKNTTFKGNGRETLEGEIYSKLAGTDGIASGKVVDTPQGRKIETPFYNQVISVDTLPKDQRWKAKTILENNFNRINKSVSDLTNAGYEYNDPLQFGYKSGKVDLMDFSNAMKADPDTAFNANMAALSRFYSEFGADKYANIIDEVSSTRNAYKATQGAKTGFGDAGIYDKHPELLRQTYVEPNNVYIATNGRDIMLPDITQTTTKDGLKLIFSDKPLSAKDMSDWEMKPIHQTSSVTSKVEAPTPKPTLQDALAGKSTKIAPKLTANNSKPKTPSPFEQDLQAAGVKPTVKPDSYVAQPKDVKKAIDAQIAKERLYLAYSLEANPRFPDGIPKIRPEDVMRISGLSPKELGIPPRYISKSALPIDEQALAHVRDRGADSVANMSDDDYLSLSMDAIDANRNKTQIAKNIRELRNDPKIIERARQTLEQEKAQYGAPEVFEPSKSDVRAYQKMVTPETASIAPQLARSRRQTPEPSTNPQNGLPQAKQLSSSQQKLGSAEPTPDSPVNESITSLDSTTKPQVNQVKVKQVGRDKNVPVMKQTRDGDVITATNVNDKVKVGEKRYSVDEDGKLIEDKKGATSLFTDKEGRVTGFRVGKEYFNAKDLGDLTSVNGYGSTLATMRRNVERAFDKKTGDKVSAFLVDHQQGQATKLIQRQVEMKQGMQTLADDLGINFGFGSKRAKKVSAAIQDFGEGKRDRASLVSEYGNKMADKIIGADKWFRKNYDTLLDEMNSTLKQFGYDPVPRRKNYYTHFQDEGLWQKFGLKMQEIRDLSSPTMQDANPTGGRGSISNKLAGMSENTAPNKAFNKFALQRKGDKHTSDAFKAFELYLNPTLNNIYMTPSISRARVLSRAIAQDAYVVGKDANKIIVQTREWANSLAGKSSRIGDRYLADTMAGPHVLKALGWAQKKTGQNTIVGNLSTAVMQPIVLGQTAGKFGYKNTMAGLYQQATGALSSAQAQSGFLKRRYTDVSPVTATKLDRGAKVANKPLEIVEENAVRSTWNAAHNDAVSQGMTGKKAIQYADVETDKTVAGRSIGERPEVFRSKSAGLATMFQLEVNNFWQQTGKEMSKTQVAKTMVAMYGLNLLLQEVTGRQVGFNPIDAAIDSYDEATKERPGEGAAVLERSKRIGQRWTGEFVDNAPFIGMAANTAFGEKAVKEWTGNDSNIGRFGASSPIRTLADNPWMAVSPFGGGQIKKTVEAVPVLLDGKLKDKEGKTLVDVPQTPRNIATGLAFGKGAIPEVSQYYSNIGKKKVDQKAVKNQSVSSAGSMSLDGLTKEQQTMLSTAREDMKPTLIEQYRKDNKAGYTAEKSGTKAPAKSTAKPLPADMPSTAKSILESYNSMSTEDKKKWDKTTATGNTARTALNTWLGGKAEVPKISNEIARDWANYEKGIKDGSINVLEKDTKKKEILRKAYNEQLSDVEKTMYKLSKADIQRYAETGDITEANLNKALTVEKQLFDAGLISKETLASKLGVAARGYKGKTAKKSGGKKGGRKFAKGKFDYKLFGFSGSGGTSNSKQLHDLLKRAQLKVQK